MALGEGLRSCIICLLLLTTCVIWPAAPRIHERLAAHGFPHEAWARHTHALPTPPKVPHLFTQLLPPRPPAFGVSVLPSCLEVQQYGGTSYSHSRYDNFLPRTTATGEPLGYEGSTLKVRPCLLLHATAPPAPATAPTFCLPAVAAAILSAHVPLTRLMPTAYCLLTNCLLTTAY